MLENKVSSAWPGDDVSARSLEFLAASYLLIASCHAAVITLHTYFMNQPN